MFVVLGIIILIVSFVVALISLVMEQRKTELSQMAKEEEGKETGIQPTEDDEAEEVRTTRDRAAQRFEEMVIEQKAASEKVDTSLSDVKVEQRDFDEDAPSLDQQASSEDSSTLSGIIDFRKSKLKSQKRD